MADASNHPRKPYWAMSVAELAAATKQYDGPIRFEDTRPLSPAMQARETRARRVPSGSIRKKPKTTRRPATAAAPNQCIVWLDDDLLARATEYARRHKTTLPEMLGRGLRGLLAFAE